MANAQKCHDGPCGPCFLCHGHSPKYSHPERFDAEQYTFLCEIEKKNIDKSVCICYACTKQIRRSGNTPTFKPRWLKSSRPDHNRCGMKNCENGACKKTHLASCDQIETLPVVSFTIENDITSVPLCQQHYNQLYCQLHLASPCDSCGDKPKKGERFNRHCPEPTSINMYLAIVGDNPIALNEKSVICMACYKHFKKYST